MASARRASSVSTATADAAPELAHELQRDVAHAAHADHDRSGPWQQQVRHTADRVVGGEPGVGVRRDRHGVDPRRQRTTCRSATTSSSANPPSTVSPVNSCRSQCMSNPRRQARHNPQLYGG